LVEPVPETIAADISTFALECTPSNSVRFMEYRYLGRTGLKVSELCLGTMTFGAATDESTAHRMLDRFV
jgi:hypothetical protein